MLPSSLVPQADNLNDIIATVEAVDAGFTDDDGIANYIEKVDRQGRYYRSAAVSMGLIVNSRNNAALTPFGTALVNAQGEERHELIKRAVLRNPFLREVLRRLDASGNPGLTKDDVTNLIGSLTSASGSTPGRRASTVWNLLIDTGYARERSGRMISQGLPGEAFVEVSENLEFPVTPLSEHTTAQQSSNPTSLSSDFRTYSVDVAQTERANLAHNELVDLMANNILRLGASPRSNLFVDMATELNDQKYIFEMKSANQSSFHGQVRHAISQLYEYAYIQQVPDAILCVVIEIPPPMKKRWLADYLIHDRNIHICWRQTKTNFNCPTESKAAIGQFM